MKKIVVVTVILVLCIYTFESFASIKSGVQFKDVTIDHALALAEKKQKPLFVFCYSSDSKQSTVMLNKHFVEPELSEFYNENFLNVKVNVQKKEGEVFTYRYEVKRYPAIYFINTNGNVISTYTGEINIDELKTFGENVMNTYASYRGFPAKIDEGEYSMQELSTFLRLEGDYPNSEKLVNQKIDSIGDELFFSTTTLDLAGKYIRDFSLPAFKKIVENEEQFVNYAGESYYECVHQVFTNYLAENPDSMSLKKMAIWNTGNPIGKLAYYDYELQVARDNLKLLLVKHEKRKFTGKEKAAIRDAYLNQAVYWLENREPDAKRIMHEVTFICENKFIKKDSFEELTEMYVSKLYEVGDQKFWNYYTDAVFQNSVGNKKKAETLMLKAIDDIQRSDPSNFRTLHWFRTKLAYL